MKVILTKNIKGSGKAGELVTVKDGYAQNFLLPKGFAKVADASGMSELKSKKESELFKAKEEEKKAEEIFKILDGKIIEIRAKAGKEGKLFGSVTSKEIKEQINNIFNVNLDKRKILLKEDIKTFGAYDVTIKLFNKITACVKVKVTEQ